MAVGAQDFAHMMNKSQMVGNTQNLNVTQQVRELEKQREAEAARDADPDSTAQDTTRVSSSSGTRRTGESRRLGQDSGALQRLGRGRVEWQDSEHGQGAEWLPPSLRPQSKTAGSGPYNIPYWLQTQVRQDTDESPRSAHFRLLNGLRKMVHNEIHQYVKNNEPPYAKKTLRDIFSLLQVEGPPNPAPPPQPAAYFDVYTFDRARAAVQVHENPRNFLGNSYDLVA